MRMMGLVVLLVLAGAACTGCGKGGASRDERLDGQSLMPGRGRLPTEPYSPVDQPGQLPYDEARGQRQRDETAAPGGAGTSNASARVLERALPPLAEPFDQSGPPQAATKPATAPGTFMTIGGVVAEVNGIAIYADKVISDLEPDLMAKARDLDEKQFRKYAESELRKQVNENIEAEMLFAAANRLLDEREKEQAKLETELWRQREVTRAGGSVEMVRRRYAAHNRNFDEQVTEAYRRHLSLRLLRKRVFPRVQVTAAEMRQYYEANREKEYTVRDAAQFEMIQIDPAKVGGSELAKQKIDDLRASAAAGEDFAALAKYSTGPRLRNSEGELSWIERNAFALPAVEEAVWKIQPGEVTPVIEDGGRFYIARLEQKRPGRVRPFEEEATQFDISEKLRAQKFEPEYKKMLQDLRDQSIVRTDPAMMRAALDMAMQRYHVWKAN